MEPETRPLRIMRSQFLTILCIFSFLSCGWGIIENTVALTNPQRVADTTYTGRSATSDTTARNDPRTYMEDRGANSDEPVSEQPAVVRQLSLSSLIYSLVTLVGVLLMFRLRRVGFYVYIVGVMLGLVLPLYFLGVAGINTAFGVFFSVIFAVMYGFCLREMK
jgi:hypothetical protein